MADYQSIYEGEQMDELWGKADSSVQGIIVNGTEQTKDSQGKVSISCISSDSINHVTVVSTMPQNPSSDTLYIVI